MLVNADAVTHIKRAFDLNGGNRIFTHSQKFEYIGIHITLPTGHFDYL